MNALWADGSRVRRKTPWKLSRTRKANVRARLKQVDSVIEAVRESGVKCAALVRLSVTQCGHGIDKSYVNVGQGSGTSQAARDATEGQIHCLFATCEGLPQGYPQGSQMDTGAC